MVKAEGETSMGGAQAAFHATLWTVILRAKGRSREALEELVGAYWKPIYFYIRRWGASVDEAKDLCQGFFTEFLERDFLKSVSREKGKFRTFLLTTLKHYLINQAERARAQKRGGGRDPLSLDFVRAEKEFSLAPVTHDTPERAFDRQWALAAIARALEALGLEMEPAVFEAVKPHLAGGPAYAETARRLGMPVTQLNNLIHRTRKRYRDLLKAEVVDSMADPAQADDELRHLLDALKP